LAGLHPAGGPVRGDGNGFHGPRLIPTYGGYPEIDGLFREQAVEVDATKREALFHKIR